MVRKEYVHLTDGAVDLIAGLPKRYEGIDEPENRDEWYELVLDPKQHEEGKVIKQDPETGEVSRSYSLMNPETGEADGKVYEIVEMVDMPSERLAYLQARREKFGL